MQNMAIAEFETSITLHGTPAELQALENHKAVLTYEKSRQDLERVNRAKAAHTQALEQVRQLETTCAALPSLEFAKAKLSQAEALQKKYPSVQSVMIGRGLIADPGMLSGGTSKAALENFMNELMAVYEVEFGGSRNAIFRLKENWGFLHDRFEGCDKLWKRLRKTTDAAEFKSITAEIFHTLNLK